MLYDFWTYSCINCVRTFPYVRAWADRYQADGLVVIGVHSPEFDFEKVHSNVEGAVKRDDVTWPVALDDDMTTWNAFKNQYWPADYVADRTGHLRYSHFGEGDYANTENVLRSLLGVAANAPRANQVKAETASGQPVNPETYLGAGDAQRPSQIGVEDGRARLPDRRHSRPHPPLCSKERGTAPPKRSPPSRPAPRSRSGMHAQSVNLVLASATGKPIDAIITLDGQPIPVGERGASVHARRHRPHRRHRRPRPTCTGSSSRPAWRTINSRSSPRSPASRRTRSPLDESYVRMSAG